MVFKFKPYSIIILRPVGQHIYTFQYFFNSTIFNQLTEIRAMNTYSKLGQLFH